MYPWMNRQLQALKRLSIGILAMAAGLLVLSQTAQAQTNCPQTLNDIHWAAPNQSNPLTVFTLLNQGPMNCQTPVYLGMHRGAFTRAMDLDAKNNLTYPNLGSSTVSGLGFASATGLTTAAGSSFPLFPQSIASVAIPAYQSYLASNRGHLPSNIDPAQTSTFENAQYNAWPAIVELDPRQDSTGTWWLFHSTSTNQDAWTPNGAGSYFDPNAMPQTVLPVSSAILANDYALYRAAPMLQGYVSSLGAPSIDQFATVEQILDTIMVDPSVNMVLQLHTRTYTDTINFYTWLLQTWAQKHTYAEQTRVISKIYFCVDLNKMAPPGQGTTTNDIHNLIYLSTWNNDIANARAGALKIDPNMPMASFPRVGLMVNFYDDTNIDDIPNFNGQTGVDVAFANLTNDQQEKNVKYLGVEISDEGSSANSELEQLGTRAKAAGLQVGKSVLTPDHYIQINDSNGTPAIKYGLLARDAPAPLVTGNNSILGNGTTYQNAWAANQANLVDLSFSLSWQMGVQDPDPTSSMSVYDPNDNNITSHLQVQPTIVLSDLPFIHSSTRNGEVRAVFPGTYISPNCTAGYPGCDDPNNPGQTAYTFCAPENGPCTFTGDRNVAYGGFGSDGQVHFKTFTFTNSVQCNESVFLNPNPGYVKNCYYGPPIGYVGKGAIVYQVGSAYCADEGETCSYEGNAYPAIAGGGKVSQTVFSVSNSFLCDVKTTFSYHGDPAPGVRKACFYQALEGYAIEHTGPSGYQFCAGENGTCEFKGPGRIAYGATSLFGRQMFHFGVFNGGVACNNSVFGDSAPTYTKDCYYQVITAVGSAGSAGNNPPGGGGGNNPPGGGSSNGGASCDLYASGGTPCVAAHSTVRALFSGYNGRLYQVKRALDNTTQDIGTLTAGGYANAAAQDSFCANTTCTITTIYDQTSKHNDLAIEGGGGAAPNPDSGAVANALPITLNGTNGLKVYGVKVTPGVGYRNNATSGVAKGGSPEGMYMVTSGTYVNSGCCFDYGNAEENSQDNGNGRMDAINFGTACVFAPCSGSGPWVEADMENGQFMGNGSNLGDQPIGSDFVTAMLKNNGQTTFALKGGNSQSGGLTTEYSGSLPTFKSGYTPMNLEGGIVLGTGGDNSNSSLGAFFEGAMTSGYPTDATEDAVQANIVSAGYSGNSGGDTIGPNGTTVPPGPYTGPSDPDGPGPQDGFASPATEQPNDVMATKPSFASFNGSLYLAFQGVGVNNDLYVTSSPTGNNFPSAPRYTNLVSSSAPALAAFNNQLFMAFRGLNVDNDFYITSSPTGSNFPTATRYTNIQMGGAPALAVFNNQLCAAFQANDGGHALHVTCSSDGYTWPTAPEIFNVFMGSDPAMTVFNGMLYVAFRANDASNTVWIASSPDGITFTSQPLAGQTMASTSSPALVVSNNVLYCIYGANDSDNEMLVTTSLDGSTWSGPAAYLNDKMGAAGPGAAEFLNGVTVGFQSNDSRNVLFVTNKVTGAASYTGPSDPGGSGPQDGFASPAALQSNEVMGTKPSFASFNGSLYVAFEGVGVNNDLYVGSSPTGSNFSMATQYTNLRSSSAPALAVFNDQLYMAFRGLNVDNDFYITSSSSGSNFPTATRYTNIRMGGAPALAAFNNQLCAAFQANDPGHALHVTCSSDGVNWPTAPEIFNVHMGSDPAMAVFNGVLYIAFRADDPSNAVWIASSSDGVNFTSQQLAGQTMGYGSSPALAVSAGVLYYIYEANDSTHEMLVTASTDGSTWQGPAAYLNNKMGTAGPAAAAFGNGVTVGFQSIDSRNVLFLSNKATEAASYTGPSDPGGPGPQDGFGSPAAQQPNVVMATKPALAAFNGSVYVAFEGVGVNNDLYVASSPSGSNFPMATQYTNLQMSSAPALAAFNNQLFVAFRGLNVNNDFYITSSPTGSNFPTATGYTNIQMGGAPALAVFNNQLYAAFQSDDPRHLLFITASSDGHTWPAAWGIPNVHIGGDPALAVFNGKLYVAFRADDPSNDVWIASSSDGVNFTSQKLAGQTMGYGSSPALAVIGHNDATTLYYIYGANDSSNEMLVATTTDGSTWNGPAAYLNDKMGALGPGATGFGNGVTVGFQSNDARNVLFVTSNSIVGTPPAPGSTFLPGSTYYPRAVRLSHGSPATNGHVVTSTDGNIAISTDGGATFTFAGTVPSQYGSNLGSSTLYELPQAVGSLPAGTLLYGSIFYYGTPPPGQPYALAIEVYTSTDGGHTWNYSSMPVSGAGYLGHGFWEPQFEVADDGALVMFWSNETDGCCSQKLSQIRTYNGVTWQDQTNTVASGIQSDRPGMVVVTKLKSGVFFMTYEMCGSGGCAAYYRTSTDGWNFGNPSNTGTRVQTASGQYFLHSPTNAWSPSVLSANGATLMIGQTLYESNGTVSPQNGQVMFANLSSDGSGPWYTIAAPVQVPNAGANWCENYSSALLPAADGSSIFELASAYGSNNQCASYYGSEPWNQLPTDGSTHTLVNQHPGFCLDNYGWGTTNSTPADLWNCTGNPIQSWILHAQGNGYFSLQNVVTGLCVDDAGGNSTPHNPVVLWGCTAHNPNQNWLFMDLGNGQYKLWNQAGGLPLDDTGGSLTPGTQLQLWLDNGLDAQHWVLH